MSFGGACICTLKAPKSLGHTAREYPCYFFAVGLNSISTTIRKTYGVLQTACNSQTLNKSFRAPRKMGCLPRKGGTLESGTYLIILGPG